VTLLLGHSAKAVIEDAGRIGAVVVESKGAPPSELHGRLIVAADGRHGKLGELARVPAVQSSHGRFLHFAYYEGLELAAGEASMIWFSNPDVAYCFPNEANLTVVAMMPTKDKLAAFRANPEEALISTFDRLPHAPKLRGARRVSDILGMIEMPNHERPPAARGMAFVGDAALTSDPIFGVGCGWALQSAQWLADAVGPALQANGPLEPALQAYATEHRARLKADEMIAGGFQRVGGRIMQPKQFFNPATLLRILWVNLTGKPLRALGPRLHAATARHGARSAA
jgi:flavin-dependent dehydrogenase